MLIAPRWRKVLRDVWGSPGRTALAVAAMAAGAFGVTAILTAYTVLTRELATTFAETHAAAATLRLDAGDGDAAAVARGVPGVADSEARPIVGGRIRIGEDEWAPLVLYVVRDFADVRIARFKPDSGSFAPDAGEILIERSSLSFARAAVGSAAVVKIGSLEARSVRIAGTVHAAGLAPGWMEHVVAGFIPWDSILRGGETSRASDLLIRVADRPLDESHIRNVAAAVKGLLEARGTAVTRIDVPAPGRHPHADQMQTFLFLLGAFGALTFLLSSVLVATMIHSLLTEQVRQVGVMKTVGASSTQVAGVYLGQVAILAALALALGLPVGISAGLEFARFSATILNATVERTAVPYWVIGVEVVAGLGVPLLVALGPVRRASRISIHEAFGPDTARQRFGTSALDRRLAAFTALPRPLLLSLRSAFAKRTRLALTVGMMAAGGAVFISAMNVSGAWTGALNEYAATRHYDVDLRLLAPQPIDAVRSALVSSPSVARVESWLEGTATLADSGRLLSLAAPAPGSRLLALPIIAGRWLDGTDSGVVVNQAARARDPGLTVGNMVTLRVGDQVVRWPIVGVVRELLPNPTAYVPDGPFRSAFGLPPGTARTYRLVTAAHDARAQLSAARDVERALERAGIGVSGIRAVEDHRKSIEDHLVIIWSALLFAAGLVVLVGSLGLTSTLSVNVLERTREIGVLSAIGAAPRVIGLHIVVEGVLMGILSWIVALAASVPITAVLARVTGEMFVRAPLGFFLSFRAALTWLALVIVLSALSSLQPAGRAARLTVREALAYE